MMRHGDDTSAKGGELSPEVLTAKTEEMINVTDFEEDTKAKHGEGRTHYI